MRRVFLGCSFCDVYRWWCVVFYLWSFCEVCYDYGGVYCCQVGIYVLFCNGVWVCADVCCVSSVVCFFNLGMCLCIVFLHDL